MAPQIGDATLIQCVPGAVLRRHGLHRFNVLRASLFPKTLSAVLHGTSLLRLAAISGAGDLLLIGTTSLGVSASLCW